MLCFAKYEARNEQPNILGMIVFQRAQLRFVHNIENVCVLGALHSIWLLFIYCFYLQNRNWIHTEK